VTESEWLTSSEPVAMGNAALKSKRASARVLRLYMVAYWNWYIARYTRPDHQPQEYAALAILERWADTGIDPPQLQECDWHLWFTEDTPDAFASTIVNSVFGVDPNREGAVQAVWSLRELFGNPFRPATLTPASRTNTVVSIASQMYEARDFSAMSILADALQDAGCDNADILDHCRGPGPHVRGCWVVDLVLGKE
jgi:hypothetical protein